MDRSPEELACLKTTLLCGGAWMSVRTECFGGGIKKKTPLPVAATSSSPRLPASSQRRPSALSSKRKRRIAEDGTDTGARSLAGAGALVALRGLLPSGSGNMVLSGRFPQGKATSVVAWTGREAVGGSLYFSASLALPADAGCRRAEAVGETGSASNAAAANRRTGGAAATTRPQHLQGQQHQQQTGCGLHIPIGVVEGEAKNIPICLRQCQA